jgi:phosphate:Na+ symporter
VQLSAANLTLCSATFFAGLAFFFLGLGMVQAGLQAVANRRFRKIAAKLVASNPLAAGWGMMLGAITQSATAVAFLLVSLLAAGLVPLTRALVAVSWANVGTSALVFVAAIDLRLVALFLVGISGLVLGLRKGGRWDPLLRAALGVGLLFLGLKFMKDAIDPLTSEHQFHTVVGFINRYLAAGFVAGALLRVVIQSSSGIIIVLMTLAAQSVISPAQSLMTIHGTGVGVGLSVLLLGNNLTGQARQIALYQALINTIAALLLALWLAAAQAGWLTGLPAMLEKITGEDVSTMLACGFGLQMLLCAVIGSALLSAASEYLSKWSPACSVSALTRPEFLSESALETPDVALVLVEREQKRVIGLLPLFLEGIRADGRRGGPTHAPSDLRQAVHELNGEISFYLSDMVARETSREDRHSILASNARQQSLDQLVGALADFSAVAGPLRGDDHAGTLATSLIEGLDTITGLAAEAAASGDPLDSQVLASMTSDRSDLLEKVRTAIMHPPSGSGLASAQAESALLYALSLFERSVWLIRQLRV